MTKIHLVLLFSFCIILNACGGGGGKGGNETPLSHDACEILGLTPKIIGGTQCNDGSSAVVKLNIMDTANCSGTMITANKVLTASHCVVTGDNLDQMVPNNSITISLGNDAAPIARSKKIYSHQAFYIDLLAAAINFPNYQDSSSDRQKLEQYLLDNGFADVAVVELDTNTKLPTLPIASAIAPNSGEVFAVFGFGLTSSNGLYAVNHLYSGEMRIEDVGPSNFSSTYTTDGSNTCRGDSGGPAIIKSSTGQPVIAGITSLGFNKCKEGELNLFTGMYGSPINSFLRSVAPEATYL